MRNNRKDRTMGLTEYGHIATEETQLRVADLLQAIAAGSAGPEYTDATFKALLDDTNTTEIFSAWWPLSAASNDSKYKRHLQFCVFLNPSIPPLSQLSVPDSAAKTFCLSPPFSFGST